MIKYTDQNSIKNQIFLTPFQQELSPDNRWVKLSEIIPWDKMAEIFMKYLSKDSGRKTVDLRTVMGAMFIQSCLNLTDRETLDMISENIYLQYFVGLPSFQTTAVFDHSLLSIFRERLGEQGAQELNEIFVSHAFESGHIKHRKSRKSTKEENEKNGKEQRSSENEGKNKNEIGEEQGESTITNKGTVKIDATVVPQDISYPTDTKLLNHARELSEQIIDHLFDQSRELISTKPRTYRREARKKWLSFSKTRKPNKKKINKQIRTQLNYLKRNLKHIDILISELLKAGIEIKLPEGLRKKMYVISELYRQQQLMYKDGRKKIADRIVSISQPWVRPIVRGKAGSPVEFGAKINISLSEQMVTVDHSSFDAYNESIDLNGQLESYKKRYDYFPEYALVDKIYMTRANRKFMKDNDILHTGPSLGRPKAVDKEEKRKKNKKNNERNHVEGKIGQGKLKYGWDKLRTKKKATSLCAINLIALAMNMLTLMKKSLCLRLNQLICLIHSCIARISNEIMFRRDIVSKSKYEYVVM